MTGRLVASGKVKDVYDAGGGELLFRFTDRASAYDVRLPGGIPGKGRALCAFAAYWFEELSAPSHYVRRASDTEIVVRRMEMVPLECVVRGYLYGGLAERHARGEAELPPGSGTALASRLPRPVFDPTTKAERDEPVGRAGAAARGLAGAGLYSELEEASLAVYAEASRAAGRAGFIMADLKLEFGRIGGELLLGDSIGPDEFRLWRAAGHEPGRRQEPYDKQALRDWLEDSGHRERFERARAAGLEPEAPEVPARVAALVAERYAEAYAAITGRRL